MAKRRKKRCDDGTTYASRNLALKELGFDGYADYLASDLWKSIRVKVYAEFGRQCWACGAPATELHHLRYHRNDLLGKRLKYIKPTCRACHEGVEFRDGKKTTVLQARHAFNRKRRHRTEEESQVTPPPKSAPRPVKATVIVPGAKQPDVEQCGRKVAVGCVEAQSWEGEIRRLLGKVGLYLRVSEVTHVARRLFLHWMVEQDGRRILDYWPSRMRWRAGDKVEEGHVEAHADIVAVAERLVSQACSA